MGVVPENVDIAVFAAHLEIAMIGRQPRVDYFIDTHSSAVDMYCTRRFLAAVAGVAFHTQHETIVRFYRVYLDCRSRRRVLPPRRVLGPNNGCTGDGPAGGAGAAPPSVTRAHVLRIHAASIQVNASKTLDVPPDENRAATRCPRAERRR